MDAWPLACLLHEHGATGETVAVSHGNRLGRSARPVVRMEGLTPALSGSEGFLGLSFPGTRGLPGCGGCRLRRA